MTSKLQQTFNQGYIIQKNVFSEKFVDNLINEISEVKNANFYYDSYNKLRRIEKLYDKGKYLKNLRSLILSKLLDIFNKEFFIFKDKFNAKPPGGQGFFPHFDGIFEFKKMKITKLGKDGMSMAISLLVLVALTIAPKRYNGKSLIASKKIILNFC